jgi:hypothetical protein
MDLRVSKQEEVIGIDTHHLVDLAGSGFINKDLQTMIQDIVFEYYPENVGDWLRNKQK